LLLRFARELNVGGVTVWVRLRTLFVDEQER
jgi:hypothetical protein